ncbi:MAG: cysteinyl-tRNA synthetase, partial [uncultured bacterium]
RGYPGWHIECSAMSMKYLGETLDIHTGGEDHLFPHHEDEIAQSEGATGKPFVNFWVHKKHILVNGEKMAKSKGNFYTIPDLEKREYAPLVYRFFILSNHYRSQTNFTFEKMDEAKNQLNRLIEFKERLEKITKDKDESEDVKKVLKETHKNFEKYINDDLNIPKALDEIFEMIKKINKIADADNLTKKDSQKALNFLKKFDEVLAILDYKPRKTKIDENEVKKLIAERNKARKEKNFKQADEIRQKLLDMGIEIKDTDKDTEWKVK